MINMETLAMAHSIPFVDHQGFLRLVESDATIVVDSPTWFAWLEGASSFSFRSRHGSFTAHKEARAPTRAYWKAYRHLGGRLQRVYLGRSAELTLERLAQAAAELGGSGAAAALSSRAIAGTDSAERRDDGQHGQRADDALAGAPGAGAPLSLSTAALDDAGTLHLLATKLTRPNPLPHLVPRPRLTAQLDAMVSSGRKLTLVAAPAGSGKTTIVAQWLRKNAHLRVAWLSLDPEDSQLPRFLAYLIAALETARPGLGAEAWVVLRVSTATQQTPAVLTSLLNALAGLAAPLVLVLDDYHMLTSQAIHDAMAFFLDRMPSAVHVVITSRADPDLPLARLRARGQLAEIRAADLHFTFEEASLLLSEKPGIMLAPEGVLALERRTEGWITGLQLAALSLERLRPAEIPQFIDAFSGSDAYVFDYLVDEVFQHQPDVVRAFLLQTSVLRRLCGPLCTAVTGQGDAQSKLEALSRANLFLVGLDSQRRWYRYHQLFQDFLSQRLEQMTAVPERALLHRRASAWFEQQGLTGEAVEHALSAEAWDDALRCLTPLMANERMYEYYLDWPRWVALLPDAVLLRDPERCLRLAWVLMRTGQGEAANRLLQLMEDERANGDPVMAGLVMGIRALAHSFRGDMAQAEHFARQSLMTLPPAAAEERAIPLYALGMSELQHGHVVPALEQLTAAATAARESSEPFLALGTRAGMASAYRLRGELHLAATLYGDVLRSAGDTTYRQLPMAAVGLGLVCYEWNDLSAAEAHLWQALAAARRVGRERYWARAYTGLARVAHARGDTGQARSLAAKALAVAHDFGNPVMIAEAEAEQAWLWFAQGDLTALHNWVQRRAAHLEPPVAYERQAEALMFCRFCIARERQGAGSADLDTVTRALQSLCRLAEAEARVGDLITTLVLLALARAVGAPGTENEPLVRALTLAAPEGYTRTLFDEGELLRGLVQTHYASLPLGKASQRMRAYLGRLLVAWKPAEEANADAPVPVEPLSERERAVLRLIAEGHSVGTIADSLVISSHTVRTHLRNIYAKLQAHNRVQALTIARALRLL
jgi:LuxR family transcriptional regulator, maltose regulon positive regulatory protein